MPPTPVQILPPAAQPVFALRNNSSRIGQGPSRVRALQVLPPSVVTWTQPSTSGLISPPPTQPSLLLVLRKNTGPSKTESTEGTQVHWPPPLVLVQKLMPDARTIKFERKLYCKPNPPPEGLSTNVVHSVGRSPPSVVT